MIDKIVLLLETLVLMAGDNRYLQATLAVVISLVVAKIVQWIGRLLLKGARKTATQIDDFLLIALNRPVFVTIVLVGLGAAALVLELGEAPQRWTVASLRTIAIVVWIHFAVSMVRMLLRRPVETGNPRGVVRTTTLPLFQNLTMVIGFALGVYAILKVWNIDITAWVASAGIVGLALSLAAKDSLANVFAGVFIVADQTFRVGDYVVLDGGERGEVSHIGLRTTRILTRDDVEITVPNSVMGNSKVLNESGGPNPKYRIRIPVGLAYGADIDRVRRLLMEIAEADERVCEDPEPRVRFRRFGDWSLDFELLCWVAEPVLRGLVTDSLASSIYKRFNDAEIEFPFPRQDIRVRGRADED